MRALGQNFLVDTRVRDAIIEASGVGPGDLVLEIGPGRGALTHMLARRVDLLVGVEVDPELAARLRRELADLPHVHIVHADILSCDIGQIVLERARGAQGLRRFMVVANLPYCITTPVLHKLLSASPLFEAFTLMIQLEVAQKLTATAGSVGYGELSLMAQYYTRPEILFTVGPTSFAPPPSVQSAVVRMTVSKSPCAGDLDPGELFAIVRAGFAKRRKNIRNSLVSSALFGGDHDLVAAVLGSAGIDGRLRAEQLGLDEFARLARAAVALGAVHAVDRKSGGESGDVD
ncbi:MAG TPA: 16S rRNA (adenine(1518)-N(6)/adenine(1519)-N(6))-dimethyltransferase RsmA [Bacillota bacterium]|nr:16S rRNA (adenine(1518)-N(6)/adenine(1519)-N(6))-dimethyltransferase RsmA [Bacillota bacterium]